MSQLSPEDALRLNVLLAGDLQAIRIDETGMTVHALSERGEASVKLHPTTRNDQYLRLVRELLAGHAIGSPGGYPVYLQRWTRMGQARDKGLDRLLLLGEPEAVVSVAYSNGLTDELARRAWWAMPVADNARRMLERESVVKGKMGKVLADYLIEHLPFENDAHVIIDTVRIVLQPGLTDETARQRLWNRGRSDNAYFVGFLERVPDELPDPVPSRADWSTLQPRLAALLAGENPYAHQLARTLAGPGQRFLATADDVLRRPADQDVVIALLNALSAFFAPVRPAACACPVETILAQSEAMCSGENPPPALAAALDAAPELAAEMRAMLALSRMNGEVAMPILNRTTAAGTLMRKKLEPVSLPILQQIAVLRGETFTAATPRRRR